MNSHKTKAKPLNSADWRATADHDNFLPQFRQFTGRLRPLSGN